MKHTIRKTKTMNNSKTSRGFRIAEFEDTYGNKCSLQESSSAMEAKIWLGVNEANPQIMVSEAKKHGLEPEGDCGWMKYPVPKEVLMNTRMHLNQKQVRELLPYLQKFADTGEL